MQRISRHNRVKRDFGKRYPGLLDVPLVNGLTSAVGSDVPAVSQLATDLSPVLNPLIGDSSTPAPAPTSSGGSSGGGSGGNGSGSDGGGSSGGDGGGTSSGNGEGNGGGGGGNGSGGSTSSGGDGNGGGSTSGDGSGSTSPAGGSGSGSGGAGGSGSSSASAGGGGGNSSSPASVSVTSDNGTSPATQTATPSSSGNGNGGGSSSSAVPAPANAGGALPSSTSNTATVGGASPQASSIPVGATTAPVGGNTATSTLIGGFSTDPAGSTPSSGVSPIPEVAAASKGLSSGAIAGIVVVCILAALAALILCFRRRAIARRSERRNRWWQTGYNNNSSGSFSFVPGSHRNSAEHNENVGGRASARSSFATNFDQGIMFHVQSPSGTHPVVPPAMPPMAQIGERNSVLVPSASAAARRQSMNSMTSNGSDEGQYLVAYDPNDQVPTTPMSVRPFSPTESFAFPKPPSAGGKSRPVSPSSSGSTFITANAAVSYPQSPASTFIPGQQTMNKYPVAPAASLGTKSVSGKTSPTPSFETAENPFEDHVEKPEFQPIETIRRPFTPSMEDELTVKPGDTVRIIKVFDDGWTFVEKLGANPAERSERERGLIPVDCLREAGQPLPTFISEKRVSSYAGANFEGPNYEELLAQIMSGNNAHAA